MAAGCQGSSILLIAQKYYKEVGLGGGHSSGKLSSVQWHFSEEIIAK